MSFVTGNNTIIKENLLVKETIRLLDKEFVVMPWANTMYEGEIKRQGDTVSVETFPRVTWSSGTTAGADITASTFTITKETLTVDQLAQINIPVTQVEEIQSNLALRTKIAEQIAYSQRDVLEQFVIGLAAAGALAGNKLGAYATALAKSDIYAAIEAMRVKLEEQNAFGNAALFVKPAIASLIKQSPEFDGFKEGFDARKQASYIGKMSGFEVYVTNNIGKYMLALDKDSVHFAAQFTGFDIRQATSGFRSNIIGEVVYGGKVFPENAKRISVYYHSN